MSGEDTRTHMSGPNLDENGCRRAKVDVTQTQQRKAAQRAQDPEDAGNAAQRCGGRRWTLQVTRQRRNKPWEGNYAAQWAQDANERNETQMNATRRKILRKSMTQDDAGTQEAAARRRRDTKGTRAAHHRRHTATTATKTNNADASGQGPKRCAPRPAAGRPAERKQREEGTMGGPTVR